ncbi:DinB family protein [Pedobacter flavus]|uniref:DinB family protein n=1 Tax=Pedobacter flavus TaxID=3113906 RepID=A0ABU7H089_9SPHI|nr:DinB family protein [Pedobacter sp. VNH31]MEE1884492.1 DinB family protein [Pedobacter sp. VNH31]
MNPPMPHEQSSWSNNYVSLVKSDVLNTLENQATEFPAFIKSIAHLENYAYAHNKWTIKEMLGHIIDVERVFAYRALCIARNEKENLPSMDEDNYVLATDFSRRTLIDLCEEFEALRKANMYLFKSFNDEVLNNIGIAGNNSISVRTLIFVSAGHVIHHINIIKERYLNA